MTENQVVKFFKENKDELVKGAGFETGIILRPTGFTHVVAGTVDGKVYVLGKPEGDENLAVLREIRGKGSMHKVTTAAQPAVLNALTALIQGENAKLADIVVRNTQTVLDQFEEAKSENETAWFIDLEGYTLFGLIKGASQQLAVLPKVNEDEQEIPGAILASFKMLRGKPKAFTAPAQNLEIVQSNFREYYGLEEEAPPAPAAKPAAKPKPEKGAKAAVKEKEAKYPHDDGDENGLVWQVAYTGDQKEPLPADVYINKIICATEGCDEPRYLKNSDLFQCQHCKKCTMRARRQRRYQRKKAKAAEAKAAAA